MPMDPCSASAPHQMLVVGLTRRIAALDMANIMHKSPNQRSHPIAPRRHVARRRVRRRQVGAVSIVLALSLGVITVMHALNTPGGAAQIRIQPLSKFGNAITVVPLQAPQT